MPLQVDIEERKLAIAEATHRVARRAGIRGVTMRAVADEMNASTTVVTHYLPTRAAVLANAVDLFSAQRQSELGDLTPELRGEQGLLKLCQVLLFRPPEDRVYDALWIELLAEPERQPEVEESLRRHARWLESYLASALGACGAAEPERGAQILHSLLAGFAVCRVEDPGLWTDERIEAVLGGVVSGLFERRRRSPLTVA